MNESNNVTAINKLAQDIPKPQIVHGIDDFDNDVSKCFIPKIKEKLFSKYELDPLILEAQNNSDLFFKKVINNTKKHSFLKIFNEISSQNMSS